MLIYLQLAAAGSFLIAGFLWIKTGKSPFWWGAMACMLAEAIRLQVIADAGPACKLFAQRVRDRFALVRSEFGEASS